jgi:hypothetical protein
MSMARYRVMAELFGQGQGFAVVSFGLLDFRRLALCSNVAGEAWRTPSCAHPNTSR